MDEKTTPPLLRFDRIPLVFGIESNPSGLFDATELVPLAGDTYSAIHSVVASLHRLEAYGLVEIRFGRRRPMFLFKRTAAGILIGERLLRDRRLSFILAIGGQSAGAAELEDGEDDERGE